MPERSPAELLLVEAYETCVLQNQQIIKHTGMLNKAKMQTTMLNHYIIILIKYLFTNIKYINHPRGYNVK